MMEPDDLVWIHDYHLLPLAAELRKLGAANKIGYFHHIPWPAREVFGTLPASIDLLRSMLDYDLVGLQTEDDADNLMRALVRDLGAKVAAPDAVRTVDADGSAGRFMRVRAFPIGIDAKGFRKAAERARSSPTVAETIGSLRTRKLLIGVDRLDYSKGVAERMEAIERFLLSNPDQRGRVSYLQIAPKTREEVPEYAILSRTVNETLGRINGSLGDPGWAPIHYLTKAYPRPVLAGLYRHARVGLVTPMRDGMNLVAKEYVAAQDPQDPGVLILSKFAGAARQPKDALIVNPYDKFDVAEAIREALYMDARERIARWQSMFASIAAQDVSWWTHSFVQELHSGSGDEAMIANDR
jgi:trehalose 6-phosphate synthase